MKFRTDILYPNPMFYTGSPHYDQAVFALTVTRESKKDVLTLHCSLEISSEHLKEMWKDGTCRLCVEIEAIQTRYRRTEMIPYTDNLCFDIGMSNDKAVGRVFARAYFIAAEDVTGWDGDFSALYQGVRVDLKKYDLVGFSNEYSCFVGKETTTDGELPSILKIKNGRTFSVDLSTDDMIWMMPEDVYRRYCSLKRLGTHRTMQALFAERCLTEVFHAVDSGSCEQDEDKNWYFIVKSVLSRQKIELAPGFLQESGLSATEIASRLLQKSTLDALEEISVMGRSKSNECND